MHVFPRLCRASEVCRMLSALAAAQKRWMEANRAAPTHASTNAYHSRKAPPHSRRQTTPPQASFDFAAPFPESGGATPLASVSSEHFAVLEAKEEAPPRHPGGAGNRTPVAIILEPARELAEQVSDCLTTFKVRAVLLFVVLFALSAPRFLSRLDGVLSVVEGFGSPVVHCGCSDGSLKVVLLILRPQ